MEHPKNIALRPLLRLRESSIRTLQVLLDLGAVELVDDADIEQLAKAAWEAVDAVDALYATLSRNAVAQGDMT